MTRIDYGKKEEKGILGEGRQDKNMCREGAVIMKITYAQSVGGGREGS